MPIRISIGWALFRRLAVREDLTLLPLISSLAPRNCALGFSRMHADGLPKETRVPSPVDETC
jgi:hypothetical protein